MPRSAPKDILLHGGPPSNSWFRLDNEGRKQNVTNGASETKAATCRGVTTKVCGIHESQPY